MAINLVSPGISIREIDLTIGRVDTTTQIVGALAGPFEKGPVEQPVLINSEDELLAVFGKPKDIDDQNEYWMSASNYLSYGGALSVIRSNSTTLSALTNANVTGSGTTDFSSSLQIKSDTFYELGEIGTEPWIFSSRNPGSWANGLQVSIIDNLADQIFSGVGAVTVGVVTTFNITVGMGVTQSIAGRTIFTDAGPVEASGYLRGIVTVVDSDKISVKVVDRVDDGVSYPVEYTDPGIGDFINSYSFTASSPIYFDNDTDNEVDSGEFSVDDWYNQQIIRLGNRTIPWSSIAPKPRTSQYAVERDSKNDELHIVVIDGTGKIGEASGQILEKHLFLSKASDGKTTPSRPVFYKDFIFSNSKLIFSSNLDELSSVDITPDTLDADNFQLVGRDWGNIAQGNSFKCVGARTYKLNGGKDYSGADLIGGYSVTNSDVINAYRMLENEITNRIDFIICGPSGGPSIIDAQAKADALIAIAEKRKDCIVSISPFKPDIVSGSGMNNSNDQTEKVVNFFSVLRSSSYAVFNSGYKYTLDRFNNKFIYISCSSDISGIMARTAINSFPWFSPAGNSRGNLNNVIKLAFNPSNAQRDKLYKNRINPIISSPGSGTFLFGDKTALSYSSAFDRINVRMLFLTIEKAIEQAARAQLFEFNDIITRNNFINIVEPYLREVTAKRGITEFLVICDESNNTPDVIDANEFKADIFIKPTRSINFVGLTFVATRTGISFSEVVGTV